MGGKRTRAGKCVYLCLACLISLAPGCASVAAMVNGSSCARLQDYESLMNRGNYDAAVKKSEEALAASPRGPQADGALFALGLVYADADNPKKDYHKSREYFARLRKEHPGSAFAGEAKIWIGVLETIDKAKQVDIDIEEKKKVIAK